VLKSKDEEKILKLKTHLMCNIQFVGELFRRNLLQISIIISIFEKLLAVETEEIQVD
jgi:hypothetical protein